MRIYYGTNDTSIDVTDICLTHLIDDNIITIPPNDGTRSNYFTDPLPGIIKSIFVNIDDKRYECDIFTSMSIDTRDNTIIYKNTHKTLERIHSKLNINHGSLYDEYNEQLLATEWLSGNEKVLEIGGNIGRNSLVIASILKDDTNFVTLESDPDIACQLIENRDLNNFNFNVENSALSVRKLIQRGWDTKPSDTLEDGYKWVNTITFSELKNKYNIVFDTLILDCEGAFYYILMDMPEILSGINLIIMENDYNDINHKNYIDDILKSNEFIPIVSISGGWGPCQSNFYEVWKRLLV